MKPARVNNLARTQFEICDGKLENCKKPLRSRVRSRMRFVGSLTHAFWVRIRRRFASYVAFGYLEARIAVRSHMHAFSHTSYHQRKLGSSYGQIEW